MDGAMMPHAERRASARLTTGQHAIDRARIRPARRATVVDISAHGALVETDYQLLPGAVVDLHLAGPELTAERRGRVTRCVVAHVDPNAIRYRAAVAFDCPFESLSPAPSVGYPLPCAETGAMPRVGEHATRSTV
jgi:hypothetical protein